MFVAGSSILVRLYVRQSWYVVYVPGVVIEREYWCVRLPARKCRDRRFKSIWINRIDMGQSGIFQNAKWFKGTRQMDWEMQSGLPFVVRMSDVMAWLGYDKYSQNLL